ncbi:hypothetical protein CSW08_13730 [Confluentibacter flavum]|uniref:Uncharacterized protein n=2 Tax=Confluentibacter flavum TaxID=1909700 RepID=A0A2N3HHT9_9FLAO|nr:hypothetical protein CSW08_13730 [Confluentibacter flavum]
MINMKTKIPSKFPFQKELIALIKKELPLHSVYVISQYPEKRKQDIYLTPINKNIKKQVTYTLLIIGHKSPRKNLGDLMAYLYNKTEQRCKVYAIFHTLANIMDRIDVGDNFLTRIISQTPCMYKEDDALLRFSQYQICFHKLVYKSIKEGWMNRMKRADYLLTVINTIEDNEEPNSKLAVANCAMEQMCLALLNLFWEYKPQHYSLDYLLHLCTHFTQLPNRIFPRTTFGLQRQYYMLCNAQDIIRFKDKNEFSKNDAHKVAKLCERFYGEALTIGKEQLKHLKEIHCQQDVKSQ